ncbi:hypothetical protein FSARC_13790 [Fusarium sarcochroum]|uniref:Aldehyde dehydrogenase domain-containing protein n=1 Tax=Fusarium sarcochroum TaxID=1208366 RepID=A0A8H4SZ51_9HYPO|nr:hypothetical protein FSARC_13790 [Fusarium sarcochroum]
MAFSNFQNQNVVPLWYNGQNQPIRQDGVIEIINAAEDRVIHHAQSANISDALSAVQFAHDAFDEWSQTPITNRRAIILKTADLLEERAVELGNMQALETSSVPAYGKFLSHLGAEALREIASQATTACTGTLPPDSRNLTLITKQAIGPVMIISPWNSPTILGSRGIASALAAGCTVVLKASELCPATYRMICQCFEDAGLPKGVLNQVIVRREDSASVTEAIIASPAIRKIEFIGSAAVGKIIGQVCAKYLKPILMELGGKAAAIVLEDADLESAATSIAFGAFVHHGQICMSTERIVVVEKVAERFSECLEAAVQKDWGNGAGNAAFLSFANKARRLLQEAKDDGAKFLVGGIAVDDNKPSLIPSILYDVPQTSTITDTESFSPNAVLYTVPEADAAVRLVNSSSSGLSGAIWTQDIQTGLALARKLEAGMVHINGATVGDIPLMAIQGWKSSGWGSNNAAFGITEFLATKSIVVEPQGQPPQFAEGL